MTHRARPRHVPDGRAPRRHPTGRGLARDGLAEGTAMGMHGPATEVGE